MAEQVRHIGDRLELFVDDYLISQLRGGVQQKLHHPQPQGIVITHDRIWEGSTSAYHTFFQDGEKVRCYYRGSQHENGGVRLPQTACLAESTDGLQWRKPSLGLFEFQGSRANNIIQMNVHNFAPFKDTNPACTAEQQYKALAGSRRQGGLTAYASSDGIHWQAASDKPVICDGKFDSQNLAFWDEVAGFYRAYYREKGPTGLRDIKTATSPDFFNWEPGEFLQYPGAPDEHLYTNQVLPYFRAPHILLGFPTRYIPDRGQITEGLFMTSRDGRVFQRWGEALIRPGLNRDRWGNRCNYLWHGLIETPGDGASVPNDLSIYASEHYYEGNANMVRRFTFRMDGFVSLNAPLAGGEVVTQPLTFSGNELVLNVSTSAAGSVRVELQDEAGQPLSGFSLDDCDEVWGDVVEHTVSWNEGSDVRPLAGQPIRLRFVMKDADIYSLRFKGSE